MAQAGRSGAAAHARTESAAFVVSAGRAVLDVMQLDWEPLSHGELEQRLDRAVEDVLEAELVERARLAYAGTHEAACFPQAEPPPPPPPRDSPEPPQEPRVTEEQTRAVQLITDLLQTSDSRYSRSRLTGRARLSLPHTVLLSLTLLSERLSYRSLSGRFRVEKGNMHRIFFSFCERVNALREQHIRWPTGPEAERSLLPLSDVLARAEGSESPKVFGVLGHTRIAIRLPSSKQETDEEVRGSKKNKREVRADPWLNLQLVCDKHGRFLYCKISRDSERDRAGDLKEALQRDLTVLPAGSFLVAKLGYPLCAQILTPFPPGCSPREEAYNRTLEAHLDTLDRAVAQLKARFRRLQYLDTGSLERAKAVVLTACVLHNVFLGMGDRVEAANVAKESEDEGEGEMDEDGIVKREAIVDMLYRTAELGCN
ncbi:uncharacterized protein LOC108941561 isoform X2 [Scleropages formosus]|uniref:Uncharacterized LOC108941561 n=2 Tax=Scleropages formosus TaxID=113540 RepID=A0A8C9UXI0_SCLFO|nr:uncharacterized protein LOC108941561 isoform X2 [Scleropages formosus]